VARSGIEKYDVFDAASKLLQEGNAPTIERIRTALGTGSYTTISKYYKEWKSSQELTNSSYVRNAAKIPRALLTAAESIWEQAKHQANEETEVIKADAIKQIEDANKILEEERKRYEALAIKSAESDTKLHEQHQLLELQRQQLEEEKKASAISKERINALEEKVQQQLSEINKLHQLAQNLQKNWEHLQKTSQEQQDKLKSELENLRQQSGHQIRQMTFQIHELTQDKQSMHHQISHLQEKFDQSKSENRELSKVVERQDIDLKSSQSAFNEAMVQINALQNTVRNKENESRDFETKLVHSNKDNERLWEERNQLKGKIQLLESKHQGILAEKHILEGRLQQLSDVLKNSRTVTQVKIN
jgi:chromosome segregation ATPase